MFIFSLLWRQIANLSIDGSKYFIGYVSVKEHRHMKKLVAFLILILLILVGGYFWLMSQSGAEHADQTIVTTSVPLDVSE